MLPSGIAFTKRLHQHDVDHRGLVDHEQIARPRAQRAPRRQALRRRLRRLLPKAGLSTMRSRPRLKWTRMLGRNGRKPKEARWNKQKAALRRNCGKPIVDR